MKTITFYSYKGGVGRSLALANIAKRLVEFNRKVCVIDFDLEAPGLPYKFNSHARLNIKFGIVDYIYDFTNNGSLPTSIKSFSIRIPIRHNSSPIYLIPAGNVESSDYWRKLSSINWYDLLYENNGLSFFVDLKEKIRREIDPDFLLIDSRTGISEMSGIALSLMADDVVVVAANNKENLTGVKRVMQSISNPNNSIFGNVPRLTFVLSRIPFTNVPEDRAKEQVLLNKIKKDFIDVYDDEMMIIHSDRDLEENEKLKIYSEFEDGYSEISKDYLKLFGRLTQDTLTDIEIDKFNKLKESERLYRMATLAVSSKEKYDLINKAISINPSSENLLFRAVLYAEENDLDLAEKDFRHVLNMDSDSFEANFGLAHILMENDNYGGSLKILTELLDKYPGDWDVYFKMALVYDKLGNVEKELECYEKCLEIDVANPTVYNNLANHYRLEKNYDKALELVFKSLELNPNQGIAFATLAEIYAEKGMNNEFYLNFELALLNKSKGFAQSISEEDIYKKYITEERFLKLLEKYNISFDEFKSSL